MDVTSVHLLSPRRAVISASQGILNLVAVRHVEVGSNGKPFESTTVAVLPTKIDHATVLAQISTRILPIAAT